MSSPKARLGVLLPTRGLLLGERTPANADLVLRLAEKVESAGLDSVWVGDSLVAKPRLEPLSSLAAIAARTSRVRLGTAVLLMALRHPVLLAQTAGTVDLISGGRLALGVGVGGAFNEDQRREWQAAGVSASRRAGRLEEMVQVVKGLGSGQPFSFHGRHFDLEDVSVLPRPVQTEGVPLFLACHWRSPAREAQFRRAARWGDGVISISDTPQEYAAVMEQVRGLAGDMGRDPSRLESLMYLTVNMDEDTGRARQESEEFLLGYYGANIWGDRWGPFGDPEAVRERLREYAAAGAQTLVVRFASFQPERQLDAFLEKVAPEFL